MATFSRMIPLAWEAPPKGLAFHLVTKWAFVVVQIDPSLDATILDVFAGGSDNGWLTHFQLFKSHKILPFDLVKQLCPNVSI